MWKVDRNTGFAVQAPVPITLQQRNALLDAAAAVKKKALLAETKHEATVPVQKYHLQPLYVTARKENVAYMQHTINKCLDYVTQQLTTSSIQKLCFKALLGNYGVRENEVREQSIMNKQTKKKTKNVAVQTSPMDVALTTSPIKVRRQMARIDLTFIDLD